MQETRVWSLGGEYPLVKKMATYSSILAWKIPWTGEPGGLQPMVSKREGHDWAHTHTHTHTQTPIPRTRLWAHRTVYGIVPTPKSNQPHWRGILLYLFIYLAFCFNILSVSALSFYMQSSPWALYPESENQGFQKVNKHRTHLRILLKYKFWGGALKL